MKTRMIIVIIKNNLSYSLTILYHLARGVERAELSILSFGNGGEDLASAVLVTSRVPEGYVGNEEVGLQFCLSVCFTFYLQGCFYLLIILTC